MRPAVPNQTDPNEREGVSTNKNYIDPPSAVFQYGLHSEPFTAHTKERANLVGERLK